MTFSEEILNGIMDVAAAHKNERGADLVGINMEGPYISPRRLARRTRSTSWPPTRACSAACRRAAAG